MVSRILNYKRIIDAFDKLYIYIYLYNATSHTHTHTHTRARARARAHLCVSYYETLHYI